MDGRNIVAKKYDAGDSLDWRYLTRNRQEVEKHINWKIHWFLPIILNFNIQYNEGSSDSANWMAEDKGQFTIASAWEVIRKEKVTDPINNCVLHKNISFNVSFFI